MMADMQNQPVSRTYQYRKVMKPMLERKRRARINRCLDELKELMVTALQSEGENVSKLEKADILELTVRHLQSLRSAGIATPAGPPPSMAVAGPLAGAVAAVNHHHQRDKHQQQADRYEEGWTACLEQVSQFLHEGGAGVLPRHEALRLMSHLTPEMPRSQEEPLWRPW